MGQHQYIDQTTQLYRADLPEQAQLLLILTDVTDLPAQVPLHKLGLGLAPSLDLASSYPEKAHIKLREISREEELKYVGVIAPQIPAEAVLKYMRQPDIPRQVRNSIDLQREFEKHDNFGWVLNNLQVSEERGALSSNQRKCLRYLEAIPFMVTAPDFYTDKLRESIARELFRPRGIPVKHQSSYSSEMVICRNTSQGLCEAALQAVTDYGDTVAVMQGTFEPLLTMVAENGRGCLVLPTAPTGMNLTPKTFQEAIDQAGPGVIKALLMVNPSGVFGTYHSAEDLSAISEIAVRNNIKIICDELYASLGDLPPAEGGKHDPYVSLASLNVNIDGRVVSMYDHSVTIQGTSKIVPHIRPKMGFAVSGDPDIIQVMNEQMEINNLAPSMRHILAVSSAIPQFQEIRDAQEALYVERLDLLRSCLHQAAHTAGKPVFFLTVPPQTGFFAGISASAEDLARVGVYGSNDFSRYLREVGGIVVRSVDGMFVGETNGNITVRVNTTDMRDQGDAAILTERLTKLSQAILSDNPPQLPPKQGNGFSDFFSSLLGGNFTVRIEYGR